MAEWISAVANAGMLFVTIGLAKIAWKALGQIEEMKTQNQNEAINQLYTRMFELQKFMLESPDFREYLLDTKHGDKAHIFLEMYADFLEQVVLQIEYLPKKARKAWENYVCKSLGDNNALKNYIQTEKNQYSKVLKEFKCSNKYWSQK